MADATSIPPDRIDNVVRGVESLLRASARGADTIFISTPKSGRTWVRVFLARYIEKFYETDFTIDEIPESSWWRNHRRRNVPCTHFCHNFFDPFQDVSISPMILDRAWLSERNCCLILRDPRDTVVSYFHQKAAREQLFKAGLEAFVLSDVYGIERLAAFNVLAFEWFQERGVTDRIFTYESLVAEPEVKFRDLLAAAGFPHDSASFDYAIEQSSFDAMRTYELGRSTPDLTDNNRNYPLRKARWSGDVNELKMRRGRVGSYLDEMPEDLRERVLRLPHTRRCIEIVRDLSQVGQ